MTLRLDPNQLDQKPPEEAAPPMPGLAQFQEVTVDSVQVDYLPNFASIAREEADRIDPSVWDGLVARLAKHEDQTPEPEGDDPEPFI